MRRGRRTDAAALDRARENAEDARTRRLYAERRLAWLERLDRDEPEALAGASARDQREIKRLYQEARDAWGEEPPEGWEPTEHPLDLLSVGMVLGMAGGHRRHAREYQPGDTLPDGSTVPPGEKVTTAEDIALGHARVLAATSKAEASPPEPPAPEPQREPPRPFDAAGIVSALRMPMGLFTNCYDPRPTGGEVDPRAVGALNQVERVES